MTPSPVTYQLKTLGCVELTRSDGTSVDSVLSQPKRLALLIYLAVASRGGFCRRDTVVGLFWPEFDQERARAALRKALHFLRRKLDHGVIIARGDEEIGVDAAQLSCDVSDFHNAIESGEVETALGVYAGDFLNGFYVSDALEDCSYVRFSPDGNYVAYWARGEIYVADLRNPGSHQVQATVGDHRIAGPESFHWSADGANSSTAPATMSSSP